MATYHVTLDSQGYMIDLASYRKGVASAFAPKGRQGDIGYRDLSLLSGVWAQESWRGGAGFDELSLPGSGGRAPRPDGYSAGVSVDSSSGDLRVGPSLTSVHAPATVTDLWAITTYAGKLYSIRGDGQEVYESADGSTWTSVYSSGETALRGLGQYAGLLLVGSGSDGDVHRYNGSTWAVWGTISGVNKVTAIISWRRSDAGGVASRAYLGATKTSGRATLYSANTTPAFAELFETPLDLIDALVIWNEALWFAASSVTGGSRGALYRYDGRGFTTVQEIPHNAITALAVFNNRLYAGSYTDGIVWQVTPAGLTELFRIPDVQLIGGTSAYNLAIRAMVVHNERLYVAVVDADGLGVYAYAAPSPTTGEEGGWSKPSTGGLGQEPRGITSFDDALYLTMKNAGGARTYRVNANTAATSGTYISSWFDATLPGLDKVLVRLTVRHAPLISGDSVSVDYALDDSTSWTNLGTSTTLSATEKTFTFTAATKARKVRIRLVITPAGSSATPKVRATLLEYLLTPDLKAEWTFHVLLEGTTELPLILKDQDISTVTGAALSDTLWTSRGKKQTLSFTDLDGEVKTVLFRDLEERVSPQSQRQGYSTRGRVTLVEV